MSTFFLRIICADKEFYRGYAETCIMPGFDGDVEILAHHENCFIALGEGETRFRPVKDAKHDLRADGKIFEPDENGWYSAVTGRGFAQMNNNRLVLLVETAERPDEIDVARARAAEERAKEQLRQKQSQMEYYHSRAELARAMERLKAARK
ncbi:MAG: F0F1 ATP synthase subunit epsilon [Eubacterium sp.]|nr:F0F1 ATP synthase subunit epsilon [Eubacterium sp.]